MIAETLAEMNDVLENNDIEDIPESSRRVIQTAMESIRSRLLGGDSVKGVAIEGFANNKDLKIAIEDNKNILQRAWGMLLLNSSRVSMIGLLVSSRRRKLMLRSSGTFREGNGQPRRNACQKL